MKFKTSVSIEMVIEILLDSKYLVSVNKIYKLLVILVVSVARGSFHSSLSNQTRLFGSSFHYFDVALLLIILIVFHTSK